MEVIIIIIIIISIIIIIIIIIIYRRLIIAQSTRTGSLTSGIFTQSNLTEVEYNTKHARFTNVIHI